MARLQDGMQLTMAQHACVAEKGIVLAEEMRALREQRNSLAEPFTAVTPQPI